MPMMLNLSPPPRKQAVACLKPFTNGGVNPVATNMRLTFECSRTENKGPEEIVNASFKRLLEARWQSLFPEVPPLLLHLYCFKDLFHPPVSQPYAIFAIALVVYSSF